jgi:hypothetical protein
LKEDEAMASEQWGVHLVSINGGGVLAPDSHLTFDGDRLGFQRRGTDQPESAPVTWIDGNFHATLGVFRIMGSLKPKDVTGLSQDVLVGAAIGGGKPGGDDIDSFVALRVGGMEPETS